MTGLIRTTEYKNWLAELKDRLLAVQDTAVIFFYRQHATIDQQAVGQSVPVFYGGPFC